MISKNTLFGLEEISSVGEGIGTVTSGFGSILHKFKFHKKQ